MVDEDILGAHQAIPPGLETHRIIVILERTEIVPLVERAHTLVGLTPHREAEHGQHRDLEALARVLAGGSRANRSNSA